jgi:CSLREA domain-containing protein
MGELVTSHTKEEAMKSVVISVLAAALLFCLDCAPILSAPIPTPGTGFAAPAGLIVVDTVDDQMSADGKCSLREAISASNLDAAVDACPAGMDDDTIILPEGHYILRLAGAGEDDNATGDLDLRSNVTLIGAGSGLTIIDGGGIDRVLDVHAGARVVVHGVTIINGATANGKDDPVAGGGDAEPGGGIRNAGDLWLLDCDVTGNSTGNGGNGGGPWGRPPPGSGGDGGGIYNRGTLLIIQWAVAVHNPGPAQCSVGAVMAEAFGTTER